MDARRLTGLVEFTVGQHVDLVRRVGIVGRGPAGTKPDGRRRKPAGLDHLEPVAPEIEPAAEWRGLAGHQRQVRLHDRLVLPDRLIPGERALDHQPEIRALANQA